MDHVVARKHRGKTTSENLALACLYCNSYKGPNLSGVDPDSDDIVPLFNPRKQVWNEHFAFDGPRIIGKTPIGRTTVEVLKMNNDEALSVRENLIRERKL
jgi:hypothetical protein